MRGRYSVPIQILAVVAGATLASCAALPRHSAQQVGPSAPADEVVATSASTTDATPTPTPTPIPPPSPTQVPSEAKPQPAPPPTKPLAWEVRIFVSDFGSNERAVTVEIWDARTVVQPGAYDLIATLVANSNPCCGNGANPTPRPAPTTTIRHYVGCCTPKSIALNLYFGGSWTVTGTVTWQGQTKPVSASGTIP
jgi:hypothetical protein